MTENDFALIEKELDIILPERYKKLALEAPLKNTRFENGFYDDPKKLIRTNLRLRKRGIYGSEPLRKNHLVVGFIFDTYNFIDVSSDKDAIYLANRTKTWYYIPDDSSHGRTHLTLAGRLRFLISYHEMDMKREQNPPQTQTRGTAEETYAFLRSLWERHDKMQQKNTKDK